MSEPGALATGLLFVVMIEKTDHNEHQRSHYSINEAYTVS